MSKTAHKEPFSLSPCGCDVGKGEITKLAGDPNIGRITKWQNIVRKTKLANDPNIGQIIKKTKYCPKIDRRPKYWPDNKITKYCLENKIGQRPKYWPDNKITKYCQENKIGRRPKYIQLHSRIHQWGLKWKIFSGLLREQSRNWLFPEICINIWGKFSHDKKLIIIAKQF